MLSNLVGQSFFILFYIKKNEETQFTYVSRGATYYVTEQLQDAQQTAKQSRNEAEQYRSKWYLNILSLSNFPPQKNLELLAFLSSFSHDVPARDAAIVFIRALFVLQCDCRCCRRSWRRRGPEPGESPPRPGASTAPTRTRMWLEPLRRRWITPKDQEVVNIISYYY